MERSFLQSYLAAFEEIEGWFSFDAALVFMAYNNALRESGVTGDVLEIGVYHGLSAIAVASLRGEGGRFHVVDLFEDQQERNVSQAGIGHRGLFEANLRRFYPNLDFVRVLPHASSDVTLNDFAPGTFSFCHIDGGHSREETFNDLSLCTGLLKPGGLVAVDDYFNASFPGVAEGCIQFLFTHPGQLKPLFTGYNKVVFQKLPGADLNAEFLRSFPRLPHDIVRMWSEPVIYAKGPLRYQLDLHASTPQHLVALSDTQHRATLTPLRQECTLAAGRECKIPVKVTNASGEAFPFGERVFGLSYHLLTSDEHVLSHDNDRTWLTEPLHPGDEKTLALAIRAPLQPGDYRVQIDLVWEGVMWFADAGNPTSTVALHVPG